MTSTFLRLEVCNFIRNDIYLRFMFKTLLEVEVCNCIRWLLLTCWGIHVFIYSIQNETETRDKLPGLLVRMVAKILWKKIHPAAGTVKKIFFRLVLFSRKRSLKDVNFSLIYEKLCLNLWHELLSWKLFSY